MLCCTYLGMIWIFAVIFCEVKSTVPVGIHNQIRATQSRVLPVQNAHLWVLKLQSLNKQIASVRTCPESQAYLTYYCYSLKLQKKIIICLPEKESRL